MPRVILTKHMKRLFTLALCTMSVFSLLGQNPMFCSFENHFGGVLDWLEAKPQVNVIESIHNQQIVVEYFDATYAYRFNRGLLYEIKMERAFPSRKEGREAYASCMRYFKMVSLHGAETKNSTGKVCRIKAKRGKLYDLELLNPVQADEQYELVLVVKEPRFMPFEMQQDHRLGVDEWTAYQIVLSQFIRRQPYFL